MKVVFENEGNKIELRNLEAGDTFLRDGVVWLVLNTRVYDDEEFEGDNHIHVVRLYDGFMDGFSPACLVKPVTVEAVVKEG